MGVTVTIGDTQFANIETGDVYNYEDLDERLRDWDKICLQEWHDFKAAFDYTIAIDGEDVLRGTYVVGRGCMGLSNGIKLEIEENMENTDNPIEIEKYNRVINKTIPMINDSLSLEHKIKQAELSKSAQEKFETIEKVGKDER